MFDTQNLSSVLVSLGAIPSYQLFKDLQAAYMESGRYYHTPTHVAECLRHARRYGHSASCLPEIEAAIWFHDAVYDTQKNNNEERSAEWAQRDLASLGARPESIDRIIEMILATKNHNSVYHDTNLLIDIDLGILGAEPAIFENYDQAIRKEYFWVSEADYRTGRSRVLASFLERPVIFKTPELRLQCEVPARENLRRKLTELTA